MLLDEWGSYAMKSAQTVQLLTPCKTGVAKIDRNPYRCLQGSLYYITNPNNAFLFSGNSSKWVTKDLLRLFDPPKKTGPIFHDVVTSYPRPAKAAAFNLRSMKFLATALFPAVTGNDVAGTGAFVGKQGFFSAGRASCPDGDPNLIKTHHHKRCVIYIPLASQPYFFLGFEGKPRLYPWSGGKTRVFPKNHGFGGKNPGFSPNQANVPLELGLKDHAVVAHGEK